MSSSKKAPIRERIEAGQARQTARELAAKHASEQTVQDQLTNAAREHPLMLIAGGLALGVMLSTLVPKSPTRKLGKSTKSFLTMAVELGLAYSRQAMEATDDAGRSGKEKLSELGSAIIEGTARLRKKTSSKQEG